MVDSIKGPSGPASLQGIVAGKTVQSTEDRRKAKDARPLSPKDEVRLSKEALTLQQADKTARDTREILKKSDLSLGLDPGFAKKQA